MTKTYLNRLIFIFSLLGLLIAAYVLQSFLRDAPIICVNNGCELVRKNPLSYPLGIPVPAVGLTGYFFLTILAFLRTTSSNPTLLKLMFFLTIFGILFVTWFTFTEIFFIKAVCTWCLISGLNMFIIFALILKSHPFKQPPHDSSA